MKTDKGRDNAQFQPAYNISEQAECKELEHSEEASEMINDLTSAYGARLYDESKRVAMRARVDHEVSTSHVEKAMQILLEREKRSLIKGISGIFSGALFGVPLAPLMSSSSLSSIPTYQYVIALLCLILGIVLAQYSISD